MDGSGEGMEGVEEQILSPPPSLVPRLHVLLSDKLQHVNPLLPGDVQAESYKPGEFNPFIPAACPQTRLPAN